MKSEGPLIQTLSKQKKQLTVKAYKVLTSLLYISRQDIFDDIGLCIFVRE